MARSSVILALIAALAVPSCSDGQLSGRDWVRDRKPVRKLLVPDGVLEVDRRIHEVVQTNYAGFIGLTAKVLKDRHLHNRKPAPLAVYCMFDAADYQKYGRRAGDPPVLFEPKNQIYMHCDGKPLIDGGRSRLLMRELTRAIMDDMFQGDCPPWIDVGVSRIVSDGALGVSKPGTKPGAKDDADLFYGLPDPDQWRPLLAGDLPTFEEVRTASRAELEKLGEKGRAVATSAIYLLRELRQLKDFVWDLRLEAMPQRDPESVLAALKKRDPRYDAHFADPTKTFFQMRPDIETYIECALAGASDATVQRSRENAEANKSVGGYWWQYASFLMELGRDDEAIPHLETSRRCESHRDLEAVLEALARLYDEKKMLAELADVVQHQLAISVLPTPTMHRRLATALAESNPEGARANVRRGLALPGDGFAADVESLRALETELGKGN